jgi:cell division septum initiation protein DivIVA
MADLMEAKLESLDILAAQIERAADAILRLKEDNGRLAARVHELESAVGGSAKKLDGRRLDDVLAELETLRATERQWQTERKEIAHRIEGLVQKLEKLAD